jgi:hypothetical protein
MSEGEMKKMEWREFCEYIKILRKIGREMRCQEKGQPCERFEDMFSINVWFLSKKYKVVEFEAEFINLTTGIVRDNITGVDINMRELLREEKEDVKRTTEG